MESFVVEDDLHGMDPLIISLVEESHKANESNGTKASVDQMSPWLDSGEHRETRAKAGCRRLPQPKDHRSITPRKLSRPSFHVRDHEIDFRHHPNSGKYIEEYRNAKLQRQDATLKAAVYKNERRRLSDTGSNCSQSTSHQHSEKPALEQNEAERKPNPLIVISSKGSSRPCNLPLEGHFQGRKLQGRPQILPRTTYVHRESLWHQSGVCTSTTRVVQVECGSVPDPVSISPGMDKHPFNVSTVQRQHCPSAKSVKSNFSTATARQSSPLQLNTNISAAIEKCDSWVKNRDQDLDNVKAKDRLVRGYSSCGSVRQGSSRASSSKGHPDLTKNDVSGNSSQSPSPKPCSDIDYSHYTDMFKNVLEYYGPKRIRPKSNISLDHRMVSLKS